jgi:hypothetical protein
MTAPTLVHDRPMLEELDLATCWALLACVPIGRIAVVEASDDVLVFPVTIAVDDHTIRFRTAAKLARRLAGRRVSFEADWIDAGSRTGWSVLGHGTATVAIGPPGTQPQPWPRGRSRVLVTLRPDSVTGRNLRPAPFVRDNRGYL